jgi:hypothetical protein
MFYTIIAYRSGKKFCVQVDSEQCLALHGELETQVPLQSNFSAADSSAEQIG